MLEKISLYDDIEIRLWDTFVESHPNGTPYHLSCWLKTIHQTYSFKPLLYVKKNAFGEIKSVLPCFSIKSLFTGSRVVSLPFSDYGGPLFNEHFGEKDVLREITKTHGRSVKYIEIRNSLDEDCSFTCYNCYKRHILNLQSDLPTIKKGINRRTILYSIRKAQKAGVEIKEENSQHGIEQFYRLNLLTRKKHGVPSQPKMFFNKLFEHIISKGNGFILLAIFDSKVIAASIFLKFGRQIHYKYNASDPEYLKKANPNHLLTWHAIEIGVAEGMQCLDFGRTSPDNKGLIRFKEMWGMKSIDLYYNYYPRIQGVISREESGWLYRFLTGIWGSLPVRISEKIGPMIYKHTA